jgi:uncharacterized protein (TIGR00251 family)
MNSKSNIESVPSGTLVIHVIPGAKVNQVVSVSDQGVIRIKLTSPPVEGKANIGLLKYLAKILGLPASKILIEHGEKSRDKRVRVNGMTQESAVALMRMSVD